MTRFLLDTNIVSEPARPRPDRNLLGRFSAHADECAVASVVWHELQYGVDRLPAGRRRDYLRHYLEEVVGATLDILPYDRRAARWHAAERARLARNGKTPSFVDGQIASIAAVNELTLVTRNISDFEDFAGLDIENWFDRRPA